MRDEMSRIDYERIEIGARAINARMRKNFPRSTPTWDDLPDFDRAELLDISRTVIAAVEKAA